jgi:hypothetical protein
MSKPISFDDSSLWIIAIAAIFCANYLGHIADYLRILVEQMPQ